MMTDTDFGDLELIERRAYQEGNMELARVAALAIDAQTENDSELEDAEKERDEAIEEKDQALEDIATLKSDLQDVLSEISNLVERTKRIGNRKELNALLDKFQETLE